MSFTINRSVAGTKRYEEDLRLVCEAAVASINELPAEKKGLLGDLTAAKRFSETRSGA